MATPGTYHQAAAEIGEKADFVNGLPSVELRPPVDTGGLTEFIEALARIVARLCAEEQAASVLSSPSADDDEPKAAQL